MSPARTTSVYLFLFVFSLYALSFSTALSNRGIGEGHVKIAVLQSLVDNGSIGLDAPLTHTVPGRGGKYYTYHEFGQNVFVLPIFLLAKGLRDTGFPFFLANAVLTALTCVLLCRMLILCGFSSASSLATALLYGVATPAWFYGAKAPFEQPVVAFLLLAAFYCMFRHGKGEGHSITNVVLGSVCAGMGLITRTDMVLALPVLALLVWLMKKEAGGERIDPKKTAAVFMAVLLPFVVFALCYNYLRFGSVWQTGYQLDIREQMFKPAYFPFGAAGFLVSPGKSIFLFAPVLLLLPFAMRAFYRKVPRSLFVALSAQVMLYFFFFSSFVVWHGDWCWGPRFFLVVTPFLVMPLAALLENWQNMGGAKKLAITVLIVVSVAVQLLPVLSNFYLGLAAKYGLHVPENPRLWRDFGPLDSLSYWRSFFVPRYSAIFTQAGILIDSVRSFFSYDYFTQLAWRLPSSDTPQLFIVRDLYGIDLWWLQLRSGPGYAAAAVLMLIGGFSGWEIARSVGKGKNPT